jgi:ABC-type lipoprotein export system ATPase subunit
MSAAESIVELRGISRSTDGAKLSGISLAFATGSFNIVTGDESVGLLMRIASLREPQYEGEVFVAGQATRGLDETQRAALRSLRFGFVFATPHLLPTMCAAENVAMPLFKLLALEAAQARERTETMLAFVGLARAGMNSVAGLSGFDQQRVALARALVHRPSVLVLDRADGNLSDEESARLFELVRWAREAFGCAVLSSWAKPAARSPHDRRIHIRDGAIDSADSPLTP